LPPPEPSDLWSVFQRELEERRLEPRDGETHDRLKDHIAKDSQGRFNRRLESARAPDEKRNAILEAHRHIGVTVGGLRMVVASDRPANPRAVLAFGWGDVERVLAVFCPLWPICE